MYLIKMFESHLIIEFAMRNILLLYIIQFHSGGNTTAEWKNGKGGFYFSNQS